MTLIQILSLAVVQGLAEMLPVSSSAHVILAEKLMGLDPSQPELTFLLVMLHTGTMMAALVYFGRRWLKLLTARDGFLKMIVVATIATGALGIVLKKGIEKVVLERMLGHDKGEVEQLFSCLPLIGVALLGAGLLILFASRKEASAQRASLTTRESAWIGLVQGLCLPFRGFSRSGATISTGLCQGVSRRLAEEFSFALAVVLTPPLVFQEFHRLSKASSEGGFSLNPHLLSGLIGMVLSFGAGLVALRWLSSWLESGRWRYFGYYCLVFSVVVFAAAAFGL